jgi:anti-sigma factor RsiW
MDRDFLISQYADGTISDADRASLERALAGDPQATELLTGEQTLTAVLRESSVPLPAIQWEALAERISAAVEEAEEPATSYRLIPRRLNVPLALAASLLIASAIGFTFYLSGRTPVTDRGTFAVAKQHVLIVTGPLAEAAPNGVSEIAIGPPASAHDKFSVARYSQELVTRPARLVIASGINPPSDPSSLPY